MYTKGIVIMAAGCGSRMGTGIPKPLIQFLGKPIIQHILEALPKNVTPFITVNPEFKTLFQKHILTPVTFIEQHEPNGTASSVMEALPALTGFSSIVVLCADTPLIPPTLIQMLLSIPPKNRVVGFKPSDISSYGAIEQKNGLAIAIIEPSEHSKQIGPYANSGILEITQNTLCHLKDIKICPYTNEYHLTKLISKARPFELFKFEGPKYLLSGMNTPAQLRNLSQMHQAFLRKQLSEQAYLESPDTVYLESMIKVGSFVRIGPNVSFHGKVSIGHHSHIETGSVIRNTNIGDNVHIKPYSVVSNSSIADQSNIGPFCHIQNSQIQNHSTIGNFVELNRTSIGPYSKAKHLAYLGDATIAEHVNIGAGVITCNYNPIQQKKYQTYIKSHAQIGANACLIAPIEIAEHSVVGANTCTSISTQPWTLQFGCRKQTLKQRVHKD